ncbi:hypothetical protein CS911_26680 (plasmid) [Klebsiella variicola]|nr:hypothetical protein [Klebsiella variicola]PHZ91447.1 hypothetical protein CS911_26680 [Klebsiella variicola]
MKLNYAAWEVKFSQFMFVTGHTTQAYFFWNEGIDVGFTDCEWEARNVNASDKYQGIRWYRGNNAINSRNNHTNSMFKRFCRVTARMTILFISVTRSRLMGP